MLGDGWFERPVDGENQWRGIDIQNSHNVFVQYASHSRCEYMEPGDVLARFRSR